MPENVCLGCCPCATVTTVPSAECFEDAPTRVPQETVSVPKGFIPVFVDGDEGPTVGPACCWAGSHDSRLYPQRAGPHAANTDLTRLSARIPRVRTAWSPLPPPSGSFPSVSVPRLAQWPCSRSFLFFLAPRPHIFELSKGSLKTRRPLLISFSASEVGFMSPRSFLF